MEQGTTIWLMGLSSSGKSTIAKNLEQYFKNLGINVQLLDGDVLRENLGHMFGYSKEDRIKVANIYRTLAKLLNKNGINVIIAAIASYEEIRVENRKKLENYIEIFLECPLDECIRRDVKGLYNKALNGKEHNVIGIDEEFEYPKASDVIINTSEKDINETLIRIIEYLHQHSNIFN